MNLIEQATLFATQKHVLDNHQLYRSILPYTHHLAAVEAVLLRYGLTNEVIRAAAWLHDVVEDTRGRPNEVKVRDIDEIFGESVGVLVGAVTSEDGPNRKTRNALTYPKIRAAGPTAVALKLADRIANLESGGRAIGMYRKEHADFRHGIYISESGPSISDTHRSVYKMQQALDHMIDSDA